MNNFVFVLDTNKHPLKPCTPKRARQLRFLAVPPKNSWWSIWL